MNPVTPPVHEGGVLKVFAKDQPEYIPLPASIDVEGTMITQWELTSEELSKILDGGQIRITLWFVDFKKPISPMKIEVVEQECGYGP